MADSSREASKDLLAYRGKDGCRSIICTRDGRPDALDRCFGWHCPRCHAPCSLQGHDCSVSIDLSEERPDAVRPEEGP